MVNVFEGQVTTMADGYYCINDCVSIILDKKMDFYRVYWMISVDWEGESRTSRIGNLRHQDDAQYLFSHTVV